MAFVTGLLLLDAPAAALNNAGQRRGAGGGENIIEVKQIRTREGVFPYVSAQAFRFWLRNTLTELAATDVLDWRSAPVFREAKIAYTDADPIKWYDDDLFGYMRAQSKRAEARERREADESRVGETPTSTEITRTSPFRVSTLVSIAPVNIVEDFGVMARQEGDPVPHEHEFYRTTLKGLFSLDLNACGTFSYREKTGFRNLDENRRQEAQEQALEHLESERCYRLPKGERLRRISSLLEGMARLEGGAKLTLHYTDVMPPLVIIAVTRGGNHVFNHMVGADSRGRPQINLDALRQVVAVYGDTLLSPIYVGWATGYLDDQREAVRAALEEMRKAPSAEPNSASEPDEGSSVPPPEKSKEEVKLEHGYYLDHPRRAFRQIAEDLKKDENAGWLE